MTEDNARATATATATEEESTTTTTTTTSTSASPSSGDFRSRFDAIRNDDCVVTSIEIRGNERTKSSLIERELRRVYEARTLEGIKDALFLANAALYEYGIFKDVAMVIDADSAERHARLGEKDVPGAKVVVNVEEKDVFNFKAGTFMSRRGEGELELATGLRNPFGYGEKFELEYVRGASSSSTYSALYEQPRLAGTDVSLDARVFQSLECFKKLSSFNVTSRGMSLGLTGDGPATMEYTLAWREINDPTRMASRAVRKQLGHSLKSSLTHVYVDDKLDRPVRPMSGYLWKLRNELAGIGLHSHAMATKFIKSEASAHAVTTLDEDKGITASLSGRLGLLLPWGSAGSGKGEDDTDDDVRTSIADRFFMGGVGCMRGFENNGCGPSDERRAGGATTAEDDASGVSPSLKRDALGGDFVWNLTAALQMDIPGEQFQAMRDAGIHFHAFASAGTLLPLSALSNASKSDVTRLLRQSTRASTGVGIVWPLPVGQIEINYGRVLSSASTDSVKNGFQVGIAAHVSM